jgi:hypothetical protein
MILLVRLLSGWLHRTEPREAGVNYNDWLAVLGVLRLVLVLLIHAEGGGESEEGGREGGAT